MNSIRTILLVDDDPDIRTIAELSLSAVGGWTVTSAASRDEALTQLESATPDVILLDVMMPGMNGITVLGKIKEQDTLSSIPVIFLTAKVQNHKVRSYLQLGASGVVAKPFDPLQLPNQIRTILAGLVNAS